MCGWEVWGKWSQASIATKGGAFLMAQRVKNPHAMQETQETWVQSLGREDPVEEYMATHSSIIAREISLTEEAGRLQAMGSQRVKHNLATKHTECERSRTWQVEKGNCDASTPLGALELKWPTQLSFYTPSPTISGYRPPWKWPWLRWLSSTEQFLKSDSLRAVSCQLSHHLGKSVFRSWGGVSGQHTRASTTGSHWRVLSEEWHVFKDHWLRCWEMVV